MPKQTFFNLPDAKREAILKTAVEEFSKAPYQEINIKNLVHCMGISIGSFYQYFEDKKDLYFYILSFYIDGLFEESTATGKHIDLLSKAPRPKLSSIFTQTRQNMKYYQEIFVDNFNKAPVEIKREWTFERIINGKYMGLYNYSFFEQPQIDPLITEYKYIMMSMVMLIPTILFNFCDRQKEPEKRAFLHELCLEVLKAGFLNYNNQIQGPQPYQDKKTETD